MKAPETSGSCRHCGLPVGGARRRSPRLGDAADAERTGQPRAEYCCSGCFMAHTLLGRDVFGRDDVDAPASDKLLARLILCAFLAMGVMVFSLSLYGIDGEVTDATAVALQGLFRLAALALSAPVLFLLGVPLLDSVVSLRRWWSTEAWVLTGVVAAWVVSLWNTLTDSGSVYFETATAVLVLFTLGRWLDARARERARATLTVLAGATERSVARLTDRGEQATAPSELRPGDLVRVRPGESVPVDGPVVSGRTYVDASSLTGEDLPIAVGPGDEVLAGMSVVDGAVDVRTVCAPGSRIRDEIDEVLRKALASRAGIVRVADAAAAVFLPVVLLVALATLAWHWFQAGPVPAVHHALAVVLIACPCALGLATPLAFWVAIGAAWRSGVLVASGETLERLARVRRVFFDKTGTLTSGELELSSVEPLADEQDQRELLAVAAALELGSEHPIGSSLVRAAREAGVDLSRRFDETRVLPGVGIEGRRDGRSYRLERSPEESAPGQIRVRLSCDGVLLADFVMQANLRPESREVVALLAERGLEQAILTGDSEAAARELGRELDLPVEAELLPADKVRRVGRGGSAATMFVGDGLNDAAALAAADVGVSVEGASPRSAGAASVRLLRSDLRALPSMLALARRAVRTARGNLVWASIYNVLGVALAATGRLTPVFAAFAMVASSVAVVLNSTRLGRDEGRAGGTAPASAQDARGDTHLGPASIGPVSG